MRPRVIGAVLMAILTPVIATAGPYTDDLSKCLVASTTVDDRVALVKWMFISFAAHPSVAGIANTKPADIERANADFGALLMRLLTSSCREKTQVALKYEGSAAIQLSFQVLGQVAGMELARNPDVQARMSGISKQIDESKIKALVEESAPKPAN